MRKIASIGDLSLEEIGRIKDEMRLDMNVPQNPAVLQRHFLGLIGKVISDSEGEEPELKNGKFIVSALAGDVAGAVVASKWGDSIPVL